ncbi:N-acetylglucosaminyl-diphospho-decaprenol L-rhamnosyltransferase [termite gut metagenome]|uniref:N-acetylglucosaminyl-diphospho-decaprenol L-rhamnosyltransferase n=1 Tax=termite gut metagenome TaxID=433724 RepID=A0A5J4PUU5_9ZZZZ
MDVSIIIVNYNTCDLTSQCLASVYENTKDVSFEIIVVDNNSSDNSVQYIKDRFSQIIFIENDSNYGFGRANNKGIEIAKGRNILFLNSDTKLLNNAVKILSDYLDRNILVGICGGNLFDEEMKPAHSYRMILPSIQWEMGLFFGNGLNKIVCRKNRIFNYTGKPREVAYITGADLMIKRNVLDSVGYFSSAFFMYYEETDLCCRVHHKGYKIRSLPDAKIQHLEGKSFHNKMSYGKLLVQNESRLLYYRYHHKKSYIKIVNILYLWLNLSRIIFYNRKSWKYELWKRNLRVFRLSLRKSYM